MNEQPTPNGERLNLLLTLLEEIRLDGGEAERPAFSLSHWVIAVDLEDGDNDEYLSDLRRSSGRRLPEGYCGTAACAIGSACLDPRFNALGLSVEVIQDGLAVGTPVYGEKRNWDAVCAFFGLTEWEAEQLFAAGAYRLGRSTPVHMVKDRLLAFTDSKGLLPE